MLHPQDVLEALDVGRITQHREARAVIPANDLEIKILELIRNEPLHMDDISVRAEIPIKEVSSTLAMMELKGMVRQMGGMNYQALHEEQADYRLNEE
ncbi:MAG: hypothetical protein HC806_07685 [Anaerolineae bacterium]|nr:hypothetical protein [Anaerolineae bacterium]